ncbi:MAG: RraA family protein, partial [Deltaproteobacteria bacterium]|nr:RraA family protein [Deltaproteobacteria bacterium]
MNVLIHQRIDRPSPAVVEAARALEVPDLCDVLGKVAAMDVGIKPLDPAMPRLVGPAFTVKVPPGDNLMVHYAIHLGDPGDVIVVAAEGDPHYAMGGGNVFAYAKHRGLGGFVVDGVVRDLRPLRALGLPVLARGVVPFPGAKHGPGAINVAVSCGGVCVRPGDLVVGDEEGVVVIPLELAETVVRQAREPAAANEQAAQ